MGGEEPSEEGGVKATAIHHGQKFWGIFPVKGAI